MVPIQSRYAETWETLIGICHYEDRYSSPESSRVYHSIDLYVGPPSNRDYGHRFRHFSPEVPIEQDPDYRSYLSVCKVCSPEG